MTHLNLEATELRLGLPGTDEPEKQSSPSVGSRKRALPEEMAEESRSDAKVQVVGWPPVRSYRKNCFQAKKNEEGNGGGLMYVKVSMDGAAYLRKIHLKAYKSYAELLKALEIMFNFTIGDYSQREGYNGSEYVPTYEDKDGDWMLVGDVPWEMFISSCKRLRIMKGSEARGLGCL